MLEEEINIKTEEITKLTEEIDEKDTIISQLKAVNQSIHLQTYPQISHHYQDNASGADTSELEANLEESSKTIRELNDLLSA